MEKIAQERTIEELADLRFKVIGVEDIGFIDAISGFLSDEENIIKLLQKRGYNYEDIIHSLRDYLIGYNIGEIILENTPDKDTLLINYKEVPLSPIRENKIANDLYEEINVKQKDFILSFDDIFDNVNSFYNIGRRDALVLEKDNAKALILILMHSIPNKEIFNGVWKYLKGFYFQKEIIKADEGKEYIEKFPPLCFYGEAHLILERTFK